MRSKIAVIGKRGQLAWELMQLNNQQEAYQLICFGRDDIDISDKEAMQNILSVQNVSAVINASAYTSVDLAEKEQSQADLINHQAVANLATSCQELSVPLVHISTDYVFSGDKGSPYLPCDETNPQSVYGRTKAEGEQAVLMSHPTMSTIIRTSWVYSAHGKNFVKTMLNLMEQNEKLDIIDDQIGSPTWAKTLAYACIHAIENKLTGIYHWTDEGVSSWYDFAQVIQKLALEKGLLTKQCIIRPIPSSAYPTPAKRPHYSVLDKTKTRKAFDGVNNRHWQIQLEKMLGKLAP